MRRTVLIVLLLMPGIAWCDSRPAALELALSVATGQIQERLRQLDPELTRVEVSPLAPSMRIPMDTREFHVRLPEAIQLGSRVQAWMDLVRNTGTQTTQPIWFEVRAYKRVPTAARDLHLHEVIAEDAVAMREINVAGVRISDTLKERSGALRTTRFVAVGRPLCAGDVEQVPPILAEQTVAVRVVSGAVVIDATAIAEQEGRVGQVIRVRNQSSAARYMALVTGNQQVEATLQ